MDREYKTQRAQFLSLAQSAGMREEHAIRILSWTSTLARLNTTELNEGLSECDAAKQRLMVKRITRVVLRYAHGGWNAEIDGNPRWPVKLTVPGHPGFFNGQVNVPTRAR